MNLQKVDKFFCTSKIVFFTFLVVILLGLSIYYLLNSISGVQQNLFDWLKSLIYDQKHGFGLIPKASLIFQILNIKLAIVFTFLSYIVFSSCLGFLFYKLHAEKYKYKDLMFSQSLKKAVRWQLYRYHVTFFPLIMFVLTAGILSLLLIIFFNPLMFFVGINVAFTSFISIFIMLNMMFLLALVALYSLWKLATLSFGTEISLSEPDLGNKKILLRSKRLIQAKPANFILLFINLAFILLLAIQFKNLDITNIHFYLAVLVFNIISYTGIKYLKTSAYINSLFSHYKNG